MCVSLLKWFLRCSNVYFCREVTFVIFFVVFFCDCAKKDIQIRRTRDHPDELRRKEVIYMKYERHQCVMT